MKGNILIFCLLFLMTPLELMAQEIDLFDRLYSAMKSGNSGEVEEIFIAVMEEEVDRAENIFWIVLAEKHEASIELAFRLGYHYKDQRIYDKAWLFFNELLKLAPEDIDVLMVNAEISMLRGKEDLALKLYEKVLEKDSHNLAANIFVGNYHYMESQHKKKNLDEEYNKLKAPTKMQYAGYRNDLDELVNSGYAKAKRHLKRAESQIQSTHVKETLYNIDKVEQESKK